MLSKGSKRKIDDITDQHSDFHVDENIESESDQSTNMPKQVKTKKRSGSSEVLDVLNQYIEEQKRLKRRTK